ncbi:MULTISPECIES: hypothetical protein [Providencia]|uniref:HNH endonuclease n=2 Tax=Providencia huaxiensis TaxID=2027290 RepID=A0ABU2J0W0_9GAMM|nr:MULTISPECIES: hypothetical protein [Providencia]MBZ3679722.1 hypothetical protein [Providencia rettgeri]AXH64146.2 hypothetical protein CYG50_20125 [Providencia huaxiensis]MDT0134948.1 hypothetical protein [Providencia huaxiensis]MDT1981353.1 hypothetical protein [Providencia huaxiensis]QLR00616.1 hypothetical protein H0912_16170 [Providencia rettgeri]
MNKVMENIERCYYCGNPATTREHVPPKCFFPKGSNLITVPSCEIHNNDKSHIDEIMRVFLMGCSPYKPYEALPNVLEKIISGKARTYSKINKISEHPVFFKLNENKHIYFGSRTYNHVNIDNKTYKTFEESVLRGLFYYLNKHTFKNHIFFFPYSNFFGYVRDDISFAKPMTEEEKEIKSSYDKVLEFFKLNLLIDKNETIIKNNTDKLNSTDYVFNWKLHNLPDPLNATVINVCLYRWYYFSGVFCDEMLYKLLMESMSHNKPLLEYNHLKV